MINKKIFILIYYLLILFFKSENIFKETMGAYPPPSGSARTSRRHCTFFLVCVFNKKKGGIKMSVIRCKTCKNLFNTAKQERYCSEECRKEARKKVRKKWETKNPEYMKNYMRGYREK